MSKNILLTQELLTLALSANPEQKVLLWGWLDQLSRDKTFMPDFSQDDNSAENMLLFGQLAQLLKLKKVASKDCTAQVQDVIAYLNERTESDFKAAAKLNKTLISSLVLQGYTAADMKAVIDHLVAKWSGTKYQEYLRPATIFGEKFENYFNAQKANANKQPTSGNTTFDAIAKSVNEARQQLR